MNDLYKLYQYNIWHLINSYKLKYYWLTIDNNTIFYNLTKNGNYDNFNSSDFWLRQYKQNKKKLGEDIISNGTFTPIFYQMIDNKPCIIAGKHRFYSLKTLSYFKPLNRKFLFIEIPNTFNINCITPKKLFIFSLKKIFKKSLNSIDDIITVIVVNGDLLSNYLFITKQIPFHPFNDEIAFKDWLKTPIN